MTDRERAMLRYIDGDREHYRLPEEKEISFGALCVALAGCCLAVLGLIVWGGDLALWVDGLGRLQP